MIAEIIGGIMANSLAVESDALHLLSDVVGFFINICAELISRRAATKDMSFGWRRAEVMGAMISILIIWGLTVWLDYEAVLRVMNLDAEVIDAKIMFFTASLGVLINCINMAILGADGHTHGPGGKQCSGHGGGGAEEDHGHAHGADKEKDHGHSHGKEKEKDHGHSHAGGNDHGDHGHSHGDKGGDKVPLKKSNELQDYGSAPPKDHGHSHDHGGHDHGSHETKEVESPPQRDSLNVRSAMIHAIGDMVQAIGVLIAAGFIWYDDKLKLLDPVCTFVFSVLVLFTTVPIAMESFGILMESTPSWMSSDEVVATLKGIPGVGDVHDFHMWSLGSTQVAVSCHLVRSPGGMDIDNNDILAAAGNALRQRHGIEQTTFQLEEDAGSNSLPCTPTGSAGKPQF